MKVSFTDLGLAFECVSSGEYGNSAYIDRKTGKIYVHSEYGDNFEELPDDLEENEERYVAIPDKRALDLGQPLVFDFVRQFLPNDYAEVRAIFSRRGAYGRFKSLLTRRNAVDRWYDFSNKAEETALREWCEDNGVELGD